MKISHDTLVCLRAELADIEHQLAAGKPVHLLLYGEPGSGKSHCANYLAEQMSRKYGWRTVHLHEASHHHRLGLDELAADIAAQDHGVEPSWDEPVPPAAASWEQIARRHQDTNAPLLIVVDDCQTLLERTLRGPAARAFADALKQPGLVLVATTAAIPKQRTARPLISLMRHLEVPLLSPTLVDELLASLPTIRNAELQRLHAFRPLLGGNPRLITTLHEIACGTSTSDFASLLQQLVTRLAPRYQARLHTLSAQQALVVAKLALAPGPTAAAHLGRRCNLPTSHTTAILDVLLNRQLVARVPGPGKRNAYAIADPMFRIYLTLRVREQAFPRFVRLLRFFEQAATSERERSEFYDLQRPFADRLSTTLAPHAGDIHAAIQTLANALRPLDSDPGNRMLLALLQQPPTERDVHHLRTATTGAPTTSAPERAVSHIALAAHLLHKGQLHQAADELHQALNLAPNWRDLALTRWLVQLASGCTDAPPRVVESNGPTSLVLAAAQFFAAFDTDEQQLTRIVAATGDEYRPLWTTIAALIPCTDTLSPRALQFFECVDQSGAANPEFLGVACVYAFRCGHWSTALRYLQERAALAPLHSTLAVIPLWLAARSGNLTAFASILPSLTREQNMPTWLFSALAVGLRHASADEPDQDATLKQILTARNWTEAEVCQIFGGLLLIRDHVSAQWLATTSARLASFVAPEPEPWQTFRDFVAADQNERLLRTLHPELRTAVELLRRPTEHAS